MKQQKCKKCGKTLEAEVTWVTDNVLQVMWYCDGCKCGLVRDVYFTGTGAPSFFEDANMRIPTLGDTVNEDYDHPRSTSHLMEGCPTDEEIQLAQDAADQKEEEYVPLVEFVRGWKEGRGYGYFPKEGL